jgi:hypothetical protein
LLPYIQEPPGVFHFTIYNFPFCLFDFELLLSILILVFPPSFTLYFPFVSPYYFLYPFDVLFRLQGVYLRIPPLSSPSLLSHYSAALPLASIALSSLTSSQFPAISLAALSSCFNASSNCFYNCCSQSRVRHVWSAVSYRTHFRGTGFTSIP